MDVGAALLIEHGNLVLKEDVNLAGGVQESPVEVVHAKAALSAGQRADMLFGGKQRAETVHGDPAGVVGLRQVRRWWIGKGEVSDQRQVAAAEYRDRAWK